MHLPSVAAAARHGPSWGEKSQPPHAQGLPQGPHLAANFLVTVLDAIDYGVLLVDGSRRLHHANRLGHSQLRQGSALHLQEGRVTPATTRATQALTDALQGAVERGLRTMLHPSAELAVAVIPAAGFAPGGHAMAALLLSRQRLCTPLALEAFARQNGLSGAEIAVLRALAHDETPERIAASTGVAVSTVRTQVLSIRAKTGASSLRALLTTLARVPPLVSVLVD